jgi:hypothetical protein
MSTSLIDVPPGETVPARGPRGSRVKACWFEEDQFADALDFGLATDRDTLEQAFRLLHDQYVAQGYMDPHPSGLRLGIHNALPSTRVFVARSGRRVVGTMMLIVDSPLGLPMDEIYADDLRAFRDERRELTEASGLALDPDCHRSGVAVLLRIIRMITLYAAEVLRSNDICIAVNPRHAAFYRKAFYFRDIGGLKHYGKVNGAPALALRLDCDLLRTFVSELRQGRSVPSEVYSFLYRKANAEQALARLREEMEQASPVEHLSYFFSRHEAWAKASLADRAHLLESYRTLAALQASPDLVETLRAWNVINFGNRVGLALA